jgi:uncharacterized protein YcgL (UPF0745 family)
MYNNQIAEELIQKYGNEKFAIYVQLEVEKNKLIEDELKRLGESDTELGYDAFFWKQKYEELLKK